MTLAILPPLQRPVLFVVGAVVVMVVVTAAGVDDVVALSIGFRLVFIPVGIL